MKNFYRLLIVVAVIALTVKSAVAQNVGIGTATPAQKLEIAGSTNTMRINGLAAAGTFIKTPTASTDKILFVNVAGDIQAILPGSTGAILTLGATGIPTWSTSATSATAWQLTGNGGTIPGVGVGNNYIGTTDAKDFVFGTAATERMRIGSTGLVGINTAPVATQQVTIASSTLGNTALVGTSTAAYGATGQFGVTGIATGGSISNYTVTVSTPYSVNAGVFGSAGRGNGTSTLGFGVVGLLGTSLPNSSAFPAGAGVLGATKTGGTAPFAAGVAAFSSGGGYGVYSNVTGGGYGLYSATTGGGVGLYTSETGASSLIPGTSGNFGVYVLGNKNTVSGVYAYMGSKGVATVPTVASAVYATTDSTLGNVWALVANNTKSTASPTGNGLLVYGTTNAIGTVTLGQNTTSYMTGGTVANGTLQFDNSSNTNTVTINTGVTTANYTLTLPTAQAASAGQVLTNDGAGVLTWSTPASAGVTSVTATLPLTVTGTPSSPVVNLTGGAGTLLYGTGTGSAFTGAGTAGEVLLSAGTGVPTWGTANLALTTSSIVNGGGSSVVVIGNGANQTVGGANATIDVQGTSGGILYGTGTGTSAQFSTTGTAGNILLSTGASAPTWLGNGTNGQVLTISGGVPTWVAAASGTAWQLTGNSGTTAGTNFIGTIDATDFVVKTGAAGGTERMKIGGTAADAGLIGINTTPVSGQQLTVTTAGTGSTAPAAVVGSNTLVVAAGSANGSAGIVGLANGGLTTFKDSSALNMSIGVYGSSGPGSYTRSTGSGFVGVGVLGLVGGSSTTFPNSQPLPPAAGVVGGSNNGGVGVVGMTSKGGTGVFATTASTNGQAAPLPVSGYGVFAVGSSKSEGAVYGFIGNGEDQLPLSTAPAVNASIYGTTNLTGNNTTTLLNNWAVAAINNNSLTAPTGNGLLVYGTTNAIGMVTLGQNTTSYMTGGTTANGALQFDNSSNTNTVTINTGVTTGSYSLTLPTTQGAANTVLTNDGTGVLTWTSAGGSSVLSNGTGINTLSYNGTAPATVSIANTGVTAGTYGSDTTVPVYNVNAQGQITSVSNVRISSGALTGSAGGDLTGSYPSPTIASIQGVAVSASSPSTGQILTYNGADWVPGNPGGGGTVTSVSGISPISISNPTSTPSISLGGAAGAILYGTGTGSAFTSAGTVGQVLESNGSGVPTWVTPGTSATAWQLTGNTGTSAGTDYIGTTDAVDFVAKTASTERMRIGGGAANAGYVGINATPVNTQQLTVGTTGLGNSGIVGNNTTAVAAGSTNGTGGVVGLANGGILTYKDSSTLFMSVGVYGSSGPGSYVRNTGAGFVGVGVLGLVGGSSTTFPNSQPLPAAVGVVGASNNGGVGVVGMTSKGGTGVYATTASTNGQVAPLPVSGYGVFAVGSSKSENAIYGFLGGGEDQLPLTTVPAVGASIYATTNLTGLNSNVGLQSYALAAVNNNSIAAPTGNGLLVYGTTNEVGTVTLGQNTTSYMTGGVTANGTLQFDNSSNTNTVTINTGVTTANYALTLPTAQAASAGQVLTNDGTGVLTWATPASGGVTSVITNSPLNNSGTSAAPVINLIGTSGSVLYGTGTASTFSSAGASGQVLQLNGSLVPTWVTANSALTTSAVVTSTTGVTITNGTGQVVGASNVSVDVATNSATSPGLVPIPTGNNLSYISNGSGVPTWGTPVTSGTAWQLTGNSGTTAGTNFIGTTDATDFVLKTGAAGGTERMRVGGTAADAGLIGINAAPVTGQQLTVTTAGTGSTTPAAVVGSNTLVIAAGSANGSAGIVGLANGGLTTFKDSSTLNMSIGVYGSSGPGSYTRSTGSGFVGVGVLGLVGGSSTTFPNSQPLPPAAGVVGGSNNGGVGVVGMTSKGGTGVYATTASTNGQVAPLPVSGYGVFAVGSSKSEGAVYGFIGNGEDQLPLSTAPAVNASIYGTTNLTGNNTTTLLNNWAVAAINNNSVTAPTGNGLLVYGTTNAIGTVTLGQNTTGYMTGGTVANGALQFDNSSNTNTVTINTGVTAANYTLTLPTAQAASAGQVLTNDGTGVLTWSTPASGALSTLSNGTGISTLSYNGTAPATVSIANTGVTAGTYGSDTTVPVYNVNAQGQITSVSNVRISSGALTGSAGGDLSGSYPAPTVVALQGVGVSATAPSLNQVLLYDGSEWIAGNPSGAGTVTSVGLALPSIFNVTGSPVTGAGTLTGMLVNQNANLVFAGPASGGAGAPTFRSLVAADLPAGAGNYIQNQNSAAQAANFYISGNASIGTAPVTGQQLTVSTNGSGSTTPAAVVGSNTLVVAAGSANGSAGIVGLANGGLTTFKDSSTLNMSIGVYGSSGPGSYTRSSGAGFVGVGVLGLVGGSSTTFPNSQPLPPAAGVVGGSNNGGVGVVGMTSKGGTGVFATTASTNGQAAPLPVSGYGVFAVGSSKSEGAVYGFIGNGEDQLPLSTAPAVNASIYGTTNLTGNNTTTLLNNWAVAAINNNSLTSPTGNGLLVYGTTNEIGTVTLGQNTTGYMTGGTTANGALQFDNSSNTNTVTINTGVTAGSYSLTLPTAQATSPGQVLTNDGTGILTWSPAAGGSVLSNGTGINTFSYNGSAPATVSILNTGVTATNYGDASNYPTFTVNAQGQLTAAGTQALPTTLPPSGAAGGDLTGTYPNPTINELQGIGVLASGANAPTNGQVLEYNGSNWVPGTPAAAGVTSVSATLPLNVINPTTTPNILLSGTAGAILYGTGGGSAFTTTGLAGQVLQSNGSGVPTWTSSVAGNWSITGNSGTTASTNFIGTTDATDFVIKTGAAGGTERMRVGGTAADAGLIGINTAPVATQQVTVASSTLGNTALVGTSTAAYGATGQFGVTGIATGGSISNYTVTVSTPYSVNAGVFGSAGRGNGTSTLGFGVVGLLGTSLPNSSAFPAGAGVLGATKTGGTAPFAAGVAAFSSGGGYGVYSNVTGGGYGLYSATTGGGVGLYTSETGASSLIPGTSGNFGVYVLGNKNTVSGVYAYMGSKGVATVPTIASAVYATTDSTLGNVWALVANNTKSTASPTGNGLLVYGTTNAIGTVTLGQNTTSYMTGGTVANGTLQFDNSSNTNTVTINTGITAGSYSLTLPTLQGAANAVLTNDGTGVLSWATPSAGTVTTVSATAPLSVTNPTTTPTILLSGTNGGILYGTGAGSAFTTAGTSGQLLQSTGAGVPTWVNASSVIANAWNIAGNSGTTAGTNFIGTTDPQDLVFKTNGNEDMRIANSTGYVGIGTNSPSEPLTVLQASDASKYVVSSSATQLTLSGHYQNVALYGYAKGGNNSHGFAVGAMSIADPGSEGGAAFYGAFDATDTFKLNNFYGLYIDATTAGPKPTYAAAFVNGNVGIGTNAPGQTLEVGTTSGTVRIDGMITGNSFNDLTAPANSNLVISNSVSGDLAALQSGTSGQVLTISGGAPTWTDPATNGTVTSVGLSVPASSIFAVTGSPVTTSGTLGITTTGISGGIPYFSSGSAISSSALLTHYGIVLGGGASSAPTTTAALTNGQVLIGSTGVAPVPDTIAVAANSGISVTNGAGTITLATNGVLNNIKVITGATTSYAPSAGTKAIQVELIGGGGGGGSTTSPSSNGSAGGGGGSGGYIKFMISNLSGSYTVAVGSGGAGGGSGSNGTAGNATTFTVGAATYTAGGGGGGLEGNANFGVPGGAGGTNSGGATISINGNPGGTSWNGNTTAACSGVGGSSVLGGGGAAVNLITGGGPTAGNGGAANSGAGGSGGVTVGHAAATGGAGAAGVIIITEYK